MRWWTTWWVTGPACIVWRVGVAAGLGWLCSAALGSGVGVTSLFNLYGNETSYLSAQTCRLAAHRSGQTNLWYFAVFLLPFLAIFFLSLSYIHFAYLYLSVFVQKSRKLECIRVRQGLVDAKERCCGAPFRLCESGVVYNSLCWTQDSCLNYTIFMDVFCWLSWC